MYVYIIALKSIVKEVFKVKFILVSFQEYDHFCCYYSPLSYSQVELSRANLA